ncbi:hypothetical protein T484DRAFT_1811284 [Baffinella frigidus]|nr:hypothetical protein T484DRAFT_1811284 [Cryptophyta sp. CCMP2293]
MKSSEIVELSALLKDASPFFDDLPMQNLRTHMSHLQFMHAAEGQHLVSRGDKCSGFWVMIVGQARVRPADGPDRPVYPGDVVLQEQALAGGMSEVSLVAHHGGCEAVFIPMQMYAQLIPAPAVTIDPDVVAEVREAARVLAIPLLKGERYTRHPDVVAEAEVRETARVLAIPLLKGERKLRQAEEMARFLTIHQAPFGSPLHLLPPAVLQQIVSAISLETAPPATALCLQGKEASEWLIVLEGTVAVHSHGSKSLAALQAGKGQVGGEGGKHGACFRIAHPGENISATAFIYQGLHGVTAVLVLRRERLSPEVLDYLVASSRCMVQRMELMRLPPPDRSDLDILNIFSSMRDNPFFQTLDDSALQKLASFVGIHEAAEDKPMTVYASGTFNRDPDPRLFILNRGSVVVFGTQELVSKVRYTPQQIHKQSKREAKRLDEEAAHEAVSEVVEAFKLPSQKKVGKGVDILQTVFSPMATIQARASKARGESKLGGEPAQGKSKEESGDNKPSAALGDDAREAFSAEDKATAEVELQIQRELYKVFQDFDTDKSGSIDASELGAAMARMGQTKGDDEIKDLLLQIDNDGSGHIDFKEFAGLFGIKTTQVSV